MIKGRVGSDTLSELKHNTVKTHTQTQGWRTGWGWGGEIHTRSHVQQHDELKKIIVVRDKGEVSEGKNVSTEKLFQVII